MKMPSLLILMLTLLLLVPGEGGSAHQGNVNDLVTTVSVGASTMIYSELGTATLNSSHTIRQLSMQISAEFKGKKKIKPEVVLLSMGTRGRWSPSDEHKPRLLIFADRRVFEALGSNGYSPSLDFSMLTFTLQREQILHMAWARKVRPQLDGVDFTLTDDQLKRLKAFAKELQ